LAELAGLPRLSTGEAYLRQTVPAALSGRHVGDATMVACFARPRQAPLSWFLCESGVALAIDRIAGGDRRLTSAEGVEAAELLDAAEPVLHEVEQGLGIALEPLEMAAAPPAGSLVATVTTLRRGKVRDRVLLALPDGIEFLPAPPQFAPELLGMVDLPASIAIPGPRVAPHDAAELHRGDLLLLGPGPLTASLKVGDARPLAGRFDPARKCFQTD
jgi:hypothetical protein